MRTVVHDLAVVLLVIFYDYYMLFILDRLLEANYGGKWESLSGPQSKKNAFLISGLS
jgi:hypothetical protein